MTKAEKLKWLSNNIEYASDYETDKLYASSLSRAIDDQMNFNGFVFHFSSVKNLFDENDSFEENIIRAKYVVNKIFSNSLMYYIYSIIHKSYKLHINGEAGRLYHQCERQYEYLTLWKDIFNLFKEIIHPNAPDYIYKNLNDEIENIYQNDYKYPNKFVIDNVTVYVYKNGKIQLKNMTDEQNNKLQLCFNAWKQGRKYAPIEFPLVD